MTKAIPMLLEAADSLLTSLTLKSDTIGNRYSLRLGRSLHSISTEMHQLLRVIIRRLHWSSTAPELVNACQRQTPKGIPGYLLHRDTSESKADEWLRGVYLLDNQTAVPVGRLSWINDPFKGVPSVSRFLFHVLYDVRELIDKYYATGKGEYLDVAKQVSHRWISECLYTERWARIW